MCDICHKDADDEIELGKFMEKSGIRVHYFCLLLASHLPQNGDDGAGILGFYIKDIKNEIRNCAERVCCFCNENHASVKCHTCSRYFHVICGLKNDCLFQFIDEFISYCNDHHGISHKEVHSEHQVCYICMTHMGPYNPLTSITASCCDLNTWVHRRCLKDYALSAGYYLKCLWCTSEKFRDEVRRLGVFVPDRDASWEQKGAFKCLYKKYSRCDADNCLCKHGRDYRNYAKWKIIVCNTCAASGMHLGCFARFLKKRFEYKCKICRDIYDRTLHIKERSTVKNLDTTLYLSKSQPQLQYSHPYDEIGSIDTEEENKAVQRFEPRGRLVDYSGLKPYVIINPEDESILRYEFLDSQGNVINKQVQLTENNDLEFDDELINKLVANLKKTHKLHETVISISDDDSEKSVGQLLKKMAKNTNVEVPKPMKPGEAPTSCFQLPATLSRSQKMAKKTDMGVLKLKKLGDASTSGVCFQLPASDSLIQNNSKDTLNEPAFKKMAKKTYTEVPKPKKLAEPSTSRACSQLTVSDPLIELDSNDTYNEPFFSVSFTENTKPNLEKRLRSKSDSMNLSEKIELFFKNFGPDT